MTQYDLVQCKTREVFISNAPQHFCYMILFSYALKHRNKFLKFHSGLSNIIISPHILGSINLINVCFIRVILFFEQYFIIARFNQCDRHNYIITYTTLLKYCNSL